MAQVMYTARTGRRLAAFWLDSFIQNLCFLPVWIQLIGSLFHEQQRAVDVSWILAGFALRLFYKWLFLYFLGGTLGKLIFGLRVVPVENPTKQLGLLQSLLRVLSDDLAIFFGQSLRALALIRLDRTHVSDWVAETRVLQFSRPSTSVKRHWILALFIIVFSFLSQFGSIYSLFQKIDWVDGQIVISSQ